MKKLIAACGLAITLSACGGQQQAPQPLPSVVTTDPNRPIVCVISSPMTDAISVTVTSLTTNPTITILSDKVPPSESVHKLCLTVNITGTLSGGKATAPAEMILQRTPTGTQLQQLSSKSFTGYVPLQNVGVGGQTAADGTFNFLSMANGVREPITWNVTGWRQRIQ
jgi:hypothetical protein